MSEAKITRMEYDVLRVTSFPDSTSRGQYSTAVLIVEKTYLSVSVEKNNLLEV